MKSTKLLLLAVFVLILVCVNPSTAAVPVAQFNGTPTVGSTPLTVNLKDNSTGSPTGWAWYFGDETYAAPWTLVNASAGWSARYYHSTVVMPDGSIVLMGGSSKSIPYQVNDTWRSSDKGATWTEVNASSGWTARISHTSVVMPDGSIVLMGGYDGSFKNDTWRSTDNGATWTLVNASSGWLGRSGHTSVVMPDGSIVLMGGTPEGSSELNDTWRSTNNGITWTLMNASSGWTKRELHSSVAIPDGSIVLMSGGTSPAPPIIYNDTWRSTDNGATWTLVNASSGWAARYSPSSVVMADGSIVLMGGASPIINNDTWRSTDNGATWTLINASSGWSARNMFSCVAIPDGSIVLMSGNGYGSTNDVWRLMTTGSLAQNPSHTYSTPGVYQVALQVYNADGYNNTRKAAYITVNPPGTATVGIYRNGNFFLKNSNAGGNADLVFGYGLSTDTPLVGDWNGDGIDTVGIYRGGNFFLKNSNTAGNADLVFGYGIPTDTPLVGDWDGNSVDTVGIYRSGNFFLKNNNAGGNADMVFGYGIPTDTPLVGDWDGDGTDTVGIYRDGNFYLKNSNTGGNADLVFGYGIPSDTPLVGDWDGDGTETVGIYRSGNFYLKNSNAAGNADLVFNYGIPTDTPLVGDWDGL